MARFLRPSLLLICALAAFLKISTVQADSIMLSNGEEVKGIVVEEYDDRIIISTYEGEKEIFKDKVRTISFDLPEQNLAKLGDNAMAKREYEKAYFYYSKAGKINPDYIYARDKMNYIMGYLFRREEEGKLKSVERMQELENWKRPVKKTSCEKELKGCLGIELEEKGGNAVIQKIVKHSPAYSAGLREGDRLVSVWGRLTGYMSPEDIARLLIEESPGEIKLTFERTVILNKSKLPEGYSSIVGGKLDMRFDGLTVTNLRENGPGYAAGLRENDLVVAINGESTRYMPIKDAVRKIEDKNYDKVRFGIVRETAMWRE